MNTFSRRHKRISELGFDDFRTYPIWTWAEDDDESLVTPLDHTEPLSDDHDALLIACELALPDGTSFSAVVSIRMSDRQPYLLSLPRADGGLHDFPLQPGLATTAVRNELAMRLHRPIDKVFPIRFRAPFVFHDGRSVEGQIE